MKYARQIAAVLGILYLMAVALSSPLLAEERSRRGYEERTQVTESYFAQANYTGKVKDPYSMLANEPRGAVVSYGYEIYNKPLDRHTQRRLAVRGGLSDVSRKAAAGVEVELRW